VSDEFVVFAETQPAPEGPVVGPSGWILNVCSFTLPERGWSRRGGDISATHLDRPRETHAVFNTSSSSVEGIPAALAFGPDGALYVTDEGHRAILRAAPDGSVTSFISEWQGRPINGPNDLSFLEDGSLFFTDPWGSNADTPTGNLFGYDWSSGTLTRLRTGMRFPNGIVARDSLLYVAETFENCVWVWDVTGPGQAANERLFCRCPDASGYQWVGPDGMCLDAEGNLYVAHLGTGAVVVYRPDGKELHRYETPGAKTTNVCFGGRGHDELFVTQDDMGAVLRYGIGVPGYRLPFCPSGADQHPWRSRLDALG
jgi:gluconolactonase